MMKKIIKSLLISIITFGCLVVLNSFLLVKCQALSVFKGDSLFQFFSLMKTLGLMFVLWITGFIIFLIWKKAQQINILLYFMILTLTSSFPLINRIYSNINETKKEIKNQICKKSSDDGMLCHFNNLTFDEYNFLKEESSWLPNIPYKTNDISITYYRDDFLGDYDLTIIIEIKENIDMNSLKHPQWIFIEKNRKGFLSYQYNEGQS